MATAKKVTKKTTAKRAPSRPAAKTTVRTVVKPASNNRSVRSFRVARPNEPFFTFRITHQTVYWAILAIIILALGLWVIDINDRVQRIYDQIDSINETSTTTFSIPKTKQ